MRTHSYFCQNKNKMGFFFKQVYLLENSRSLRAVLAVRFARYPGSPQSATETWTGVEFVGLEI